MNLTVDAMIVCRICSTAGMTATSFVTRYDKLDQKEIKDLLLCFLYIVRNLSEGMQQTFCDCKSSPTPP